MVAHVEEGKRTVTGPAPKRPGDPGEMKGHFSTSLPVWLQGLVRVAARRKGRSLSGVVEEALFDWLKTHAPDLVHDQLPRRG